MKLLRTELRPLLNEVMKIEVRNQPFLCSPFHHQPSYHYHPEPELVYIVKGYGKRLVGNCSEDFEPGDMVFLGSNVAHVWLSDPIFYKEYSTESCQVIVVHFKQEYLDMLCVAKELTFIKEMLMQSTKGFTIHGSSKDRIAELISREQNLTGFERVEMLLKLMNEIACTEEKEIILADMPFAFFDENVDRLIYVLDFVKVNLQHKIVLKDVSQIACMTEQSFCRYFKRRMKKRFFQYVNDIRIEKAKELLVQTDMTINNVADLCGFSSASHFCYSFKQNVGNSPIQYRMDAISNNIMI